LIEAMRQVNSSRLYVVGEGELEGPLKEYVRNHGMSNVTFCGHLATVDLIPLIQRAAFTVVPSEWYENYPMTIVESFACGTPVIGSNIGGIPELIDDNETGLLSEPGDAQQLAEKIQCLLDHPEDAVAMGHAGRQKVQMLNNPENYYLQIFGIYRGLLGSCSA
jgi:glycosyltransferase involved in cell wall biosynthesis